MPLPRILPLAAALLMSLPLPLAAQDLAVAGSRFAIGAEIAMRVDLPDSDAFPGYVVALRQRGGDSDLRMHPFSTPRADSFTMKAPAMPGSYEVVLRRQDGAVLRRHPVELRFVPAPGAIRAPDSVATRSAFAVAVTLPQGIHTDSPWVGLYSLGRRAAGGAAMGDQLVHWQWAGTPDKPATLKAPAEPGPYEVRLIDRREGAFVLDRHRIEVHAAPIPGALLLDRDEAEIASEITATVRLDPDRVLGSAWLGLFDPAEELVGGAVRVDDQKSWGYLNRNALTHTFRVPTRPGRYEVRLYDADGDAARLLDSVDFRATVTGQPGAIGITRTDVVVGEVMPITVTLRPDRTYGSSWIGLFAPAIPAGAGNAERSERTMSWAYAGSGSTVELKAPSEPGTYELRMFDRDGDAFVIDRRRVTVTAPPVPGAVAPERLEYDLGEPVVATVTLPEGRYYGSPILTLYRLGEDTPEGVENPPRREAWTYVKPGQSVDLGGLARPGRYELVLTDRDTAGFVLDRAEIRVIARRHDMALALDRATYAVGQQMQVTVDFPAGHYSANPRVAVRRLPDPGTAGDAPLSRREMARAELRPDRRDYVLTAPDRPGRYEVLLFDRSAPPVEIARREVTVLAPPRNMLQIRGRSFAPGDTVTIRTRRPQGIDLPNPGLAVYRSSYVLKDGGFAIEQPVFSRALPTEDGELTFKAPNQPGAYEVRVYDRSDSFHILDIEPFEVVAAGAPNFARTAFRLTPMPGAGGGAAGTGPVAPPPGADGLPLPAGAPGDGTGTGDGAPARPGPSDSAEEASGAATPTEETATPADTAPEGTAATPRSLRVLMPGPAGLVPVTRLEPGQSFVVEARYDVPPQGGTAKASLAFGTGPATVVTLSAGPGGTLLRSPVLRVPASKGDAP